MTLVGLYDHCHTMHEPTAHANVLHSGPDVSIETSQFTDSHTMKMNIQKKCEKKWFATN